MTPLAPVIPTTSLFAIARSRLLSTLCKAARLGNLTIIIPHTRWRCQLVEDGPVKQRFVSDLQTHDELVNEPFLLQDVVRRTTRDGRPYLLCTYADRTGQAAGVFWDVPEHIEKWIRPGLAVLVTGRITEYRNAPQINTTDLNRWRQPEMALFLP